MNKRDWIKKHRADIDAHIRAQPGMESYTLNDNDRADWIANDESLYRWARSAGVNV